ncbi:hypothetical protein HMPREF9944_01355 [Segatella maculosa OT 289]|uniref:Uncharacterized protein n=1 Tax=Segatella maculosa OT 289 TaxID=999422 RepID=H1HMA1_9BACT|nr:hypothetical protein HMPREF9944_01355 [Segatella maculosa OT 289]
MGEITAQYGCNWNTRCKSLIINVADARKCLSACRDARFVRPLKQSCMGAFNSTWVDARSVRLYISKQGNDGQKKEGSVEEYPTFFVFLWLYLCNNLKK